MLNSITETSITPTQTCIYIVPLNLIASPNKFDSFKINYEIEIKLTCKSFSPTFYGFLKEKSLIIFNMYMYNKMLLSFWIYLVHISTPNIIWASFASLQNSYFYLIYSNCKTKLDVSVGPRTYWNSCRTETEKATGTFSQISGLPIYNMNLD